MMGVLVVLTRGMLAAGPCSIDYCASLLTSLCGLQGSQPQRSVWVMMSVQHVLACAVEQDGQSV